MIDLNTIWFVLLAVLLAGYAVLDGFDLGVGVLSLFTKDETERRIGLNAIAPVWDGNEVWLLTAGGALFAAFPIVYATAFSAFYLAFMLLVAALIFRAASFEFRGKVDSPRWRRWWDWSFGLGSLVPALLYGVAVGNVLRGLPLDATMTFTGSFLGLLNPYALLVGVTGLVMFTMHGAAYLCLKTDGSQRERMRWWVARAWAAFVVLYALATVATLLVAPHVFHGVLGNALWWVFLVVLVAALAAIPIMSGAGRFGPAFFASCGVIVAVIGLAGVGLYPRLVPSSTDLAHSLTIYNGSSSQLTLAVMLVIALLGMPLVVAYTAYVYRVFRGKVELTEDSY